MREVTLRSFLLARYDVKVSMVTLLGCAGSEAMTGLSAPTPEQNQYAHRAAAAAVFTANPEEEFVLYWENSRLTTHPRVQDPYGRHDAVLVYRPVYPAP